jgi:hypothetical protein
MEVLYAVEGLTDAPVAEKLILHVGRVPRVIVAGGGKSAVDDRLRRWARSGNPRPILALRDWDRNDRVDCVPELLRLVFGQLPVPPTMVVRIAVRAVESWLMADLDGATDYFGTSRFPPQPDELVDPKQAFVKACQRSRERAIREGVVPRSGSGRSVGDLYEAILIDFARNVWSVERARLNSPSLDRALERLSVVIEQGLW